MITRKKNIQSWYEESLQILVLLIACHHKIEKFEFNRYEPMKITDTSF